MRTSAAIVSTICLAAGMAQAQFGRGGAEWTTTGSDAQRSFWLRTDQKVSRESLRKPGFQLIWKLKLDNDARQAFSPPVQLDRYIGYRGFRSLAFVGLTSGKLVGIDSDLGRVEWQKQLPGSAGQSSCAGAAIPLTRPATAAFPSQPVARGGFGGRGGPARSAVGEAGEGAVTIRQAVANSAAFPGAPGGPAGRGAAGRGAPPGFGRMPSLLYAVTPDGALHSLYVSNGEPSQPSVRFTPANSNVQGLIVIDNVAYAAAGTGCDAPPDTVLAADLESKTVTSFKPQAGAIAGTASPSIGPDGALYVATTAGDLVALEPKTLKVKDAYKAGEAFATGPVIFEYKGKVLIAAAANSGSIHLLDSAAINRPLFKSNPGLPVSSLASWQDAAGVRWLLGSTAGAVVAWKVADQNGAPSLQPGWTSRDLSAPIAPIIVNGVAFTASTGSALVVYAFDAATGKDLWNSGKTITAALRGGGLSFGNSQLYLGTNDGTLYVFGYPIEH